MKFTAILTLFTLQVFLYKNVFSYPANDYILAYIPIEEFAYLTSAQVEVIPVTSYELVYPVSVEIGTVIIIDEFIYYNGGQRNGRCSCPACSNMGYAVYTPMPATIYRPPKIPTVSILPSVSVPISSTSSTGPVLFPTVPNDPYEAYGSANNCQRSGLTIKSPPKIASPMPVAGKMGFCGPVPAAGSVKIYAKYC